MSSEDEQRRLWFRREVLPLEPQLRLHAQRYRHPGGLDAEDLVHETFAKLITYLGWRDVEHVGAFAMRVMRNQVLQAARRAKIVPFQEIADLEAMNIADEGADAERTVEARDQLRALMDLVKDLPPQCRRVFTLRKIYGMSNIEIADRLGLSISTVEKHSIKALRICSEGLARLSGRGATAAAPGMIKTFECDESRHATKPRDGSCVSPTVPATASARNSKLGARKA